MEEFQDQRNSGKNQQEQTQAKHNQQAPLKEASAADMLGNLSRMAGNFNVVSHATSNMMLGSGANASSEPKEILNKNPDLHMVPKIDNL